MVQLSHPYMTTGKTIALTIQNFDGKVKVKVTQSCPTACNPMDYRVHGMLQARILEWVAFPLLQRIFPTQGLNPGLPHCGWILYQLIHKGSWQSEVSGFQYTV